MLFSSLPFLLMFLPLFFLTYFIFAKTRYAKNITLLVFSLIFYAWGEPLYIILLLLSIVLNFYLAVLIDKFRNYSKFWVIVAVVVNILFIGVFKYANFAVEIVNGIFQSNIPTPNIVLPIGISFYTFQILSYVIDVYWKKVDVQKNVLYLGAYLTGFPQLIAGPIVRYETIAYEIENRTENIEEIANGAKRFIIGLAKKILIANNVAVLVDKILAQSGSDYGALGAWIAMIGFALQIYYDFSGYSDMAIGIGHMMGFHYLENFNYPYIAKSVTDFWRRWHISLSTFFRDYVYIPLGGNRVSHTRWIVNMVIVWFLTGLWHGANWTFILWGVYFGLLLILEKKLLSKLQNIPVVNHISALIAILFGWVIFRADNVSQIGDITKSLVFANGNGSIQFLQSIGVVEIPYLIALILGIVLCTPIFPKLCALSKRSAFGKISMDIWTIVLLVLSIGSLLYGSYNPFIYFRF